MMEVCLVTKRREVLYNESAEDEVEHQVSNRDCQRVRMEHLRLCVALMTNENIH